MRFVKVQYFPILLVVLSSLFYHICQKSMPAAANPFVILIVTYASALVVSIVTFFIFTPDANLIESLKATNFATLLLGLTIVGVELGFLMSYRAGWNISAAGLLTNTLGALLLIPVGLLFYNEKISFTAILGIILCIAGLILVSKS